MLKLQNRLKKIKSYIRENSAVYDVGTDHALIPAALVLEGHLGRITASDVAQGPISRAKENLASFGIEDSVNLQVADGLSGIELEDTSDIIIAGMGGELVRDIIDSKPDLRRGSKRLILQAMTKRELLNDYLAENGFAVTDGGYVSDSENGKVYCVVVAEFNGVPYELTAAQRLLGALPWEIAVGDGLFTRAIFHEIRVAEKKLKGKQLGDEDFSEEQSVIEELNQLYDKACKTN